MRIGALIVAVVVVAQYGTDGVLGLQPFQLWQVMVGLRCLAVDHVASEQDETGLLGIDAIDDAT